jgi:hypothetical protein
MASVPGLSEGAVPMAAAMAQRSFAKFIDHWMFVIMAALFLATALTGFIPDSLRMLRAVDAGKHAPVHPALHLHAVLMGTWLVLLLVQSTLMATGRRAFHKQLGMVAVAYVPAIIVTGILVIKVLVEQNFPLFANMEPPEAAANRTGIFSLVLYLIREGLLFLILMNSALLARRTDAQLHKRLVILATVLPLTAAFERLAGVGLFPRFGLYDEAFWDVCCLLWILPMFLWDLARSGRVHRAYLVWLILFGVTAIPVHLLRETAWWNAAAARLLGVDAS